MSIRTVLTKAMERSGGRARVVPVPADKRPDAESLKKLEREIAAQIDANEAMRNRSIRNADKRTR